MKRNLPGVLVLLLFFAIPFQLAIHAQAADSGGIEPILRSAEKLFEAMESEDYPLIWSLLTRRSRDTIVKEVYTSSNKPTYRYTSEQIGIDFKIGGLISRTYWGAFLKNFNPGIVLNDSRWKMGEVKKDRAYIVITYNKSERPAILKMRREGDMWKVGLVETFWIRKKLDILKYLD